MALPIGCGDLDRNNYIHLPEKGIYLPYDIIFYATKDTISSALSKSALRG
jgi:hypothetical protein